MKESDETKLKEIKLAVETGVTDREFWHSRTPQERIWATELMRRRDYGYDEHSLPGLQRVIEFATLKHYQPRRGETEESPDLPSDQS
jgi:hypothetical protein